MRQPGVPLFAQALPEPPHRHFWDREQAEEPAAAPPEPLLEDQEGPLEPRYLEPREEGEKPGPWR
jgi:hypothetical protein